MQEVLIVVMFFYSLPLDMELGDKNVLLVKGSSGNLFIIYLKLDGFVKILICDAFGKAPEKFRLRV